MTGRRGMGAVAVAAALMPHQVNAQFAQFSPAHVDVLPTETVVWTNVSNRRHTVTSDAGLFMSSYLESGQQFTWTFPNLGGYPYHCTVHPGMTGEIDVRRVTLAPVPTAVLRKGTAVALTGRTADPSAPVRIERSADGTHYATVATATPDAAGDWQATLQARTTGDYRAAAGNDVSEVRRVLVSDSHVNVHPVHGGVAVAVTPKAPYARIVLQLRLREHFGWWPAARKRLDYVSRARFDVRRHARLRVALVDRDGWTPLALSRVVTLRR